MIRAPRLALACLLLLPAACTGNGEASKNGLTAGEEAGLERAVDRLEARAPSPARPAADALETEVATRLRDEQAGADRR